MNNNDASLAVKTNPIPLSPRPAALPVSPSLNDTMRIAEILSQSGYFSTIKNPAQAFAKILYGQELGLGPMASIAQIHMVDGKATMDATLIAAQIKRSGKYDYRVKESTDTSCVLEFFERGQFVGESSFTMAEATRAGLAGKQVWKSYPKDMVRSRAMTRGARMFCPDSMGGAIYTPEELGGEVSIDDEGTMQILPQSAALPPAPQAQAEPEAPTSVALDKVERATLIRGIYGILGLDPKGAKKDDPMHEIAISRVAVAIGREPKSTTWSGFTLDELRNYAAGMYSEEPPQEDESIMDYASEILGGEEESPF